MPRGDRTGPDGMGPMTGRGLGYCAGYDSPGFTRGLPRGGAGYGRGFGRGFGRGYGRGFGGGYRNRNRAYFNEYGTPPADYYPDVSEKTLIENDMKILKEQLKSMEKRLSELTSGKEEK
ncbi:MAG TPA: hypothetical protein ENL20_08510 [Candidatus Cloacimonetes bacterium]|nr:hypothetical protein [Candidatus Cloacimonadota bacterium]